MEHNLILAGVGGQGILTIAQAISIATIRRGWHVKQAEVHGMSQRGGDVQSHLRISDKEIKSDLIPLGKADMILAVEPLESLRYLEYLSPQGYIVSSTAPFVNIPNYWEIEKVIDRITQIPHHVLVDADRLAKAAGSARAGNVIMLGAASIRLGFDLTELESAITEIFQRKGEKIVETNCRACRFGRNAARAYLDGIARGNTPQDVRHWIETIPTEELADGDADPTKLEGGKEPTSDLSGAEAHAVLQTFEDVYKEGRRQLYEHEVYRILELVGAISPPRHHFLPVPDRLDQQMLDTFPGEQVVLKLVSEDVVHKSDSGGVQFVPKQLDAVNQRITSMVRSHTDAGAKVAGVLVIEYVETKNAGFGQELFVGIRSTREFGAIIAAGLGGVDTEYLATKMKPGIAVAKALVNNTTAEEFFELFKKTAAYDVVSGRARGHKRVVSDGELLRCFRAFMAIARRVCVDRGEEGPDLRDLEVNPFAFVGETLIPLDGRGRLGPATKTPVARPLEKVNRLLEPRSIAVMGVSGKRENFGRIILRNVIECGFDKSHLYVLKDGEKEIDGIRCIAGIDQLPEEIDLLVVSTSSAGIDKMIDEIIASKKIASVILIPGNLGETASSAELQTRIRKSIAKSRDTIDKGPVFLGGNSMGLRSKAGNYDTFFIPNGKLDPRRDKPAQPVAVVSQSGAFIISRLSNLESLDLRFAVSAGNQLDLTVSDALRVIGTRDDIHTVGVYVEGFNDMDGLAFVHAVEDVAASGKTIVFYKAGRTASGRSATAGHTASVAGDYDVCQAVVSQAGAIVVETFKEFEYVLEISARLHDKQIGGCRVGMLSNAGYETVGMADNVVGPNHNLQVPELSAETCDKLGDILTAAKLGDLVNRRNPLDLTPMANEKVYVSCTEAILEDSSIDAVIMCCVPLTPQMATTPDELDRDGTLGDLLPALVAKIDKPLLAVIDSGPLYNRFVAGIRAAGVPVFRSADEAMRALGRYMCHRAR